MHPGTASLTGLLALRKEVFPTTNQRTSLVPVGFDFDYVERTKRYITPHAQTHTSARTHTASHMQVIVRKIRMRMRRIVYLFLYISLYSYIILHTSGHSTSIFATIRACFKYVAPYIGRRRSNSCRDKLVCGLPIDAGRTRLLAPR